MLSYFLLLVGQLLLQGVNRVFTMRNLRLKILQIRNSYIDAAYLKRLQQ